MGSYMGSSIPARDIPRYIALWKAGKLPVERLLSAKRPLAEINAALDDLASGAAVRQILLPRSA
jgi:alcohol dehydrogenase